MKVGMDHNQGLTDEQDIARYMKRDLKKHKSLPYKIIRDEVVGRHMVATRDIKPGEVIFEEPPLTYGPSDNTKSICLGCYEMVTKATPPCVKGCGYPMCSQECSDIPEHRDNECQMLRDNGYKCGSNVTAEDYAIISPMRTLAMKRNNHPNWDLVWMHMSHQEAREKSTYWTKNTNRIIDKLRIAIGLSDPEEIQLVKIILGIHLVNDFEITPYFRNFELGYETTEGAQSIRGLFALASMPSHNCVANATHDFSNRQDGFKMTMRAVVKIPKGADITHSYTEPLDSIMTRRALLKMGKFFDCNCKRCNDPTELGTYTSALICQKCYTKGGKDSKQGRILPESLAKEDAMWKCESCDLRMSAENVAKICTKIKFQSEALDANPNIKEYESFVAKYSGKVLHPNHVLMVDKQYNLAKMYGRMAGYEADVMTDDQLKRKQHLCETVLKVLDKIMPGRMRKRAMMMYELHVPLVMTANRNLQRGPSSGSNPDQLKANLKAGLFNLRMSLEILKDEPEGSFEWKIVQGSSQSLTQLEDWVNTVCSSI